MLLATLRPPSGDDAAPVPPAPDGPRLAGEAPLAPAASARPISPRRDHPRVLVVEDDETCRRGISRNLRLAGYEVLAAADGVEALALLEAHGADVVVTDLMMPNMDGVDLILNLVLGRQGEPRIPVIAITGSDDWDGRIRAARRFGAQRVLSKPFGSQALVAAIADALEP